jgi:hypothetical protein
MKPPGVFHLITRAAAVPGLMALLLTAQPVSGAEPSLTEYQVKALCLLNFTRYVEWPSDAFAETNSPIAIGVVNENKFLEALKKTVEGKCTGGHPIVIREINSDEDWARCHVLFVGAAEKNRFGEILDRLKTKPVLTIGEADGFRKAGGVINFVNLDGKVRFKINLSAAHEARLQISSRLLSLAEDVSGR